LQRPSSEMPLESLAEPHGWLRRVSEPRLAIPLLLATGLALRLYNLGESLWLDEVAYSTHYRSPDVGRLWLFLMRIPGPPLYPVFAFLWVAVAGDHEVIVRLPSLVFGLGSIVLTYEIARRYAGERAALVAGLFLCLSPVHVWYSQEAAPYSMATFLVLAAVAIWPRVSSHEFSWAWYGLFVVASTAAVLTHYYAAAFLVPFVLLACRKDRYVLLRTLLAAVVALGAVAAWLAARHAYGIVPRPPGFLRSFTGYRWWMLFFQYFLHGNSLGSINPYRATASRLFEQPWIVALQIGGSALLLRGLWPAEAEARKRPIAELAMHVFALPAAVYLLTLTTRYDLYIDRYFMMTLPFFAITLAWGAVKLRPARLQIASVAALLALSVAAYGALVLKPSTWTVYKPNPAWKPAAAFLGSKDVPMAQTLIVQSVPLDDFIFYLRKAWPRNPIRLIRYERGGLARRVRRERHVREVVLVKNAFWAEDIDQAIGELRADPRVQFKGVESFRNLELHIFVRADRRTTARSGTPVAVQMQRPWRRSASSGAYRAGLEVGPWSGSGSSSTVSWAACGSARGCSPLDTCT